MEKKWKCDLIYNGYSIRVLENYELIKQAIDEGSTFLELTEENSDYKMNRKYLANVKHIIAIIPVYCY
jgi:hypothetical protein